MPTTTDDNKTTRADTTPTPTTRDQILSRGVKSLEMLKDGLGIQQQQTTSTSSPSIMLGTSTSNDNRNRANSSGSAVYSPSGDNHYIIEDDDDDDDSYHYLNYSGLELDYKNGGSGEQLLDALAPGENSNKTTADLCGSMWKRRGGLGRNAERNWVMRSFTLYGPILCYHEEANTSNIDPSKPRARLNLSKIETIAEMSSKEKPGLPSQNLLTINIYDPIVHAKRKWEMCCTTKEQQLLWYKAIKAYDGKPVGATIAATTPTTQVMNNKVGEVSPTYRLLPPRPSVGEIGGTMDEVELIARAAVKAAEIMDEKQSSQQVTLSNSMLGLMLIVLNVAIYFVRNGSDQIYKMTCLFINGFVLYVACYQLLPKTSKPKGPKARAAKSRKKSVTYNSPSAQQQHRNQSTESKISQTGTTIPRASPKKNTELDKVLQTHEATSAEAIRAYASSPTNDIEVQPHSYSNTDASTFHLRVGPNYKKNKQKSPSAPTLYDLVSMDFLYADTALKNTSDRFRIPSIPGVTDISTGHAHIPPMLIINTWLPGEEPSMFAKNTDGETYSIPMIFVLSKDTIEQLKDISTASPGVKLLSEWCRRAESEDDFRGRFKCMGSIESIEDTGVPKFIHGYNGKPALVTKSGTFTRHENYIEFTINVNMWAYLAKKGLHTLIPTFPEFIFNIGFTIEGRSDDELPEVLLGGCRLLNLNPDMAVVDE